MSPTKDKVLSRQLLNAADRRLIYRGYSYKKSFHHASTTLKPLVSAFEFHLHTT